MFSPFAHYSRKPIPKGFLGTGADRYRYSSRQASMPAYLVEVAAKAIVWTDEDQETLAANVYALVTEFIHDDDHIVDLEVDTFPLPLEPGGGSSDRRDGADPEEGSEAPVP